jgi:Putative prokaryotic signal transducing protein
MGLVRLTVVPNEIEAEILTGRLHASGVDAVYRSIDEGTGIAALGGSGSPVEVLVEERDLADAQTLLSSD